MCEELWTGDIHVDKLEWQICGASLEDLLGVRYENVVSVMETVWAEYSSRFDIYNGDLVGVLNFREGVFECFTYSFKEHLAMVSLGVVMGNFRGNLGFKLHLYSPDGQRVLVGRRSSSGYMAGYLSSVGGMFEHSDIWGSIADAVLRELEEESGIGSCSLDWASFRLLAIQREMNGLAINLVLEVRLVGDVKIKKNDEFESLDWMHPTEFVGDRVMSHLHYCQSE